jgi:hypothetical protein
VLIFRDDDDDVTDVVVDLKATRATSGVRCTVGFDDAVVLVNVRAVVSARVSVSRADMSDNGGRSDALE